MLVRQVGGTTVTIRNSYQSNERTNHSTAELTNETRTNAFLHSSTRVWGLRRAATGAGGRTDGQTDRRTGCCCVGREQRHSTATGGAHTALMFAAATVDALETRNAEIMVQCTRSLKHCSLLPHHPRRAPSGVGTEGGWGRAGWAAEQGTRPARPRHSLPPSLSLSLAVQLQLQMPRAPARARAR